MINIRSFCVDHSVKMKYFLQFASIGGIHLKIKCNDLFSFILCRDFQRKMKNKINPKINNVLHVVILGCQLVIHPF